MEAKESLSDHDNVPMTAPEFDQDFECREDDSVSLDGGEEFSAFLKWGESWLPPLPLRWRVEGMCKPSPVQTIVRTHLPLYPDCIAELSIPQSSNRSMPVFVQKLGRCIAGTPNLQTEPYRFLYK